MDDRKLRATVQLLADIEAIEELQAKLCFVKEDDDWIPGSVLPSTVWSAHGMPRPEDLCISG